RRVGTVGVMQNGIYVGDRSLVYVKSRKKSKDRLDLVLGKACGLSPWRSHTQRKGKRTKKPENGGFYRHRAHHTTGPRFAQGRPNPPLIDHNGCRTQELGRYHAARI